MESHVKIVEFRVKTEESPWKIVESACENRGIPRFSTKKPQKSHDFEEKQPDRAGRVVEEENRYNGKEKLVCRLVRAGLYRGWNRVRGQSGAEKRSHMRSRVFWNSVPVLPGCEKVQPGMEGT